MRWTFNALPWEEAGERLAMVTLTYPDDWRAVCPDGHTLKHLHLARFRLRWVRQWGKPLGAWAMEFQRRGAPHIHMYVGCPDVPIKEFRKWALSAWSAVVGSDDRRHVVFGVNVRPCFYGSAEANGRRVADYFWRESGKQAQKVPPPGFERLGRYWGVWYLKPRVHEVNITRNEFVTVRRPLRTLRDKRAGRRVPVQGRSMDGLYVVGVDGIGVGVDLLRWAQGLVEERRQSSTEDARS